MSSWQNVGLPTIIFLAGLLNIPDDVLEAAALDGASRWRTFWSIKLPLLKPVIGIVAILTFVGNFTAFDIIFAMAGSRGEPAYSTDLLATYFYRTGISGEPPTGQPNAGLGAAIATVTFLILAAGASIWLYSARGRPEGQTMRIRHRVDLPDPHRLVVGRPRSGLDPARSTRSSRNARSSRRRARWPQEGTLDGYRTVIERGDFPTLFRNSILVTGISIAIVLLIGSMAGLALSQWRCRTSSVIYFVFVAGLMIPIRLATIDIVRMVERVGLIDSYWGLIPVYVAMSLPVAVFVLTGFVNELPDDAVRGGADRRGRRVGDLPATRRAAAAAGAVDRGRAHRAADLERRVVPA